MSSHAQDFGSDLQALAPLFRQLTSSLATLEKALPALAEEHQEIAQHAGQLRRSAANAPLVSSRRRGASVTPEFARFLGASAIGCALDLGRLSHIAGAKRHALRQLVDSSLMGFSECRSALTSGDMPLPAIYSGELVSLVAEFGAARKFATIMPMGAGRMKLPRLKTSPVFGFITMGAAIGQKSPQIEFVDFPPEKAGGVVRIPSELDEDSLVRVGAFVAEYVARELARFEDDLVFNADGTSTYKSFKGVLKSALDNTNVVTLGSTKTKPSDITLADLRAMRGNVASAALLKGAYYFHPTMEAHLQTFNTSGVVYFQNTPGGAASLEGFPIRWVDVLPVYDTAAHASALQGCFGDISYQFLGVVSGPSLAVSRDVYFATDELAVRGLERLATALMDSGAASVVQLAAS